MLSILGSPSVVCKYSYPAFFVNPISFVCCWILFSSIKTSEIAVLFQLLSISENIFAFKKG